MSRHILTLNAGSSSIKFALFDVGCDEPTALAVGLAEMLAMERRIRVRGADGSETHQDAWANDAGAPFHAQSLERVLGWRQAAFGDANVIGVGHRVVHGGTRYDAPVAIDDNVLSHLQTLVPLAPLRTWVLGAQANDRAAGARETQAITRLLREAMDAGAFGFSTTAIPGHIGHNGKPLAARLASREELQAYCGVLKSIDRGIIEMALTKRHGRFADDEFEFLEFLVNASGRNVSWLSMHNLADDAHNLQRVLERVAPLMRRGAKPQILSRPLIAEMSLKRPFHFGEISAAKGLFDQGTERQMEIYADPEFRSAFRAELKQGRKFSNQPPTVGVLQVGNAKLRPLVGRSMSDIATERGSDPLDCMFDIAVEDKLETIFFLPRANTDQARIAEALRDSEHNLLGLSDAGAHVDMLCEAGYPTYLLGHWVREQKALTLEHAVKRLTSEPADYFGIKGRGRLTAGNAADIVVFDPRTVGSPTRPTLVHDLPAGGGRMVAKAHGVRCVVVNGTTLYRDGQHTGAYPGQVLRSV